jgi:pimeloyl-ACP methyl ester carboxylesterase
MATSATHGTRPAAHGSYASVNGLRIYYEIHGAGRPLFLLHGGVGASEMFGPTLPKLAESRQVVAVHLQGHGRTADVDRPLSFQSMADDIAALARHLELDSIDLMGYSLGGGAALQVAIRHPEMIRKLVIVSAPFRRDGFYPEVLAGMAAMGPEVAAGMTQSPLYRLYPDVNWATLFTKLATLLGQDYDWSEDVAALKMPVMAVYADADAIRPAHIVELFELLGGGRHDAGLDGSDRPASRLAVLPGASHYDAVLHPALPGLVTAFLDAALPGVG